MSPSARKAFFIVMIAASAILGFACYKTYWEKAPLITAAGFGK